MWDAETGNNEYECQIDLADVPSAANGWNVTITTNTTNQFLTDIARGWTKSLCSSMNDGKFDDLSDGTDSNAAASNDSPYSHVKLEPSTTDNKKDKNYHDHNPALSCSDQACRREWKVPEDTTSGPMRAAETGWWQY